MSLFANAPRSALGPLLIALLLGGGIASYFLYGPPAVYSSDRKVLVQGITDALGHPPDNLDLKGGTFLKFSGDVKVGHDNYVFCVRPVEDHERPGRYVILIARKGAVADVCALERGFASGPQPIEGIETSPENFIGVFGVK